MRRLTLIPALAMIAMFTAACADDDTAGSAPSPSASPSASPSVMPGLPDGVKQQPNSPAGVVTGHDPGSVWVITFGSSTNPAIARKVTAEGQTVTVDVSAEPNKPSTMDLVPTSTEIRLPDSVSLEEPATFVLGDFGTVKLDLSTPDAEAWVDASK